MVNDTADVEKKKVRMPGFSTSQTKFVSIMSNKFDMDPGREMQIVVAYFSSGPRLSFCLEMLSVAPSLGLNPSSKLGKLESYQLDYIRISTL
jgi:hypothetical protein